MGMLVDAMVALFLLAGWVAIRRGGSGRVLHRLAGLILTYGAAALVALVVYRFGAVVVFNLWLRLLIVVVGGTVAGGGMWWWWRRGRLNRSARWQTWADKRGVAPAIQMLAIAGWVGVNVVLLIVVVNVVAVASPPVNKWVRTNTWGLALLLDHPTPGALQGDDISPAPETAPIWQRSVSGILAASGAARVVASVETLQWISTLTTEELEGIVASEPALQRVIDDPQLVAVLANERVMDLVHAATAGSWSAIYALGGETVILALIESSSMRAAIAAVDLVSIRSRLQAALPSQQSIAVIWQARALVSSLDLDTALARPEAWENMPPQEVITFPATTRYALVRTVILQPGPPQQMRLVIRTSAALSCWVDNVLQRPSAVPGGQGVDIAFPTAHTSEPQGLVVILFDFGANFAAATTLQVLMELMPKVTVDSATTYSSGFAPPVAPVGDPRGDPAHPARPVADGQR